MSEGEWSSKANAACVKATSAIAERGWPADITEIKPRLDAAAKDIRAAADTIKGLPRPQGAQDKTDAVVRSMGGIEPVLADAARASAGSDLEGLNASADKLTELLTTLSGQVGLAGLDDCLSKDEQRWAPDAIRAPVYAEHLSRTQREYMAKLRKIGAGGQPASLAQARRRADALTELVADYAGEAHEVQPPWWVKNEVRAHQAAVKRLQRDFEALRAELSGTRPPLLEELERIEARLKDSGRREEAAYKKLWNQVGADPVTSPTGETPGAEES